MEYIPIFNMTDSTGIPVTIGPPTDWPRADLDPEYSVLERRINSRTINKYFDYTIGNGTVFGKL